MMKNNNYCSGKGLAESRETGYKASSHPKNNGCNDLNKSGYKNREKDTQGGET